MYVLFCTYFSGSWNDRAGLGQSGQPGIQCGLSTSVVGNQLLIHHLLSSRVHISKKQEFGAEPGLRNYNKE